MDADNIDVLLEAITRGVPADVALRRLHIVCWRLADMCADIGYAYLVAAAAAISRLADPLDGPAVLAVADELVAP